MAKKLYEEANIQAIADAIRAKTGSEDTYTPAEMAGAIEGIQTGRGDTIAKIVDGSIVNISAEELNGATFIRSRVFQNCVYLTSIVIPDSVMRIGDYAFQGCSSLTSIAIPNGVTTIGSGAFQGCSSLTSIAIPNGVTTIGFETFSDCSSLTSVIIPSSVMSITDEAFRFCTAVEYYDFSNHTAVPTLSSTLDFVGIQSRCEIRVPAALYNEWIAATNWSAYADYIVAV